MKTNGIMIITIVLSLLLPSITCTAQISGPWHSSFYDMPITDFSMSLKGPVKSWSLSNSKGETRTIQYDAFGKVTDDTFRGTTQTFVPLDFMLIKLKKELERKYPIAQRQDTSTHNNHGQLIHKQVKDNYDDRVSDYNERNIFDPYGNILTHQKSYSTTEMRAWNSLHGHDQPTYITTTHTSFLAIFRYNQKRNLREIEYLHSDPFQNLKMVYLYDANDNLIATNRYDHYNIRIGYMKDNYLSELIPSDIDTNFSITSIYPEYWSQGSPAHNEWKFNDQGQKIEYNAYGYKPNGGAAVISFIAKWEYDEKGQLKKEIHFDTWHNRISTVLEFDPYGNVIKETEIGYDGKKDKITEMKIEYYSK